jgi:hypothetical protein
MNPTDLARAIIHWLEYERLCGRDHLFSEASLRNPIGQYLLANLNHSIEPEQNYPDAYQPTGSGRRRAMDFAVLRKGGQQVLLHALESKLINSKREFKQEIFDDLFRLASFETSGQTEPCERWLIIAGRWTNLRTKIFEATTKLRDGGSVSKTFRGILKKDLTSPNRHATINHSAPGIRKLWVRAAEGFGQKQLPNAIDIDLAAKNPRSPHPTGFCCFIWKVKRSPGFKLYDI